ncbi:MAG: DoxX family protein [Thiobacillaceae bacterium]|nr:DoxX family protein [Thiobacillaceae bacterium]
MERITERLNTLLGGLDMAGSWLAPLALRLLLAKEFWDAGVEKFHGRNWFGDIQDRFPFPFNLLPADLSWQIATWFELIGPIALVLGLGTRFFSVSLSILTLVAIAAVHAGHGYTIAEGGWKLPLIYLVMFLPLILSGPGKLSLDHWLRGHYLKAERRLWS